MTLRVLIIGGGIGGLISALCLHARGIQVQVFERMTAIRPLGVGINLLPHAVSVLHELGLAEKVAATAIATSRLQYYNKFGQLIWSEPRGMPAGYPVPQYSIHRGILHALLHETVLERLGPAVQLGASFEAAWQHDGKVHVRVVGEDGRSREVEADVLIGADGIHSAVRRSFHPHEGPPKFAQRLLWRAVTEGEPFLDGRTMIMAGHQDQKFVCYPISQQHARRGRALLNWIAELAVEQSEPPPQDWNRQVDAARFADRFREWRFGWLNVPALIQGATQIYEFPLADRDPLPQWTHGRSTLLGDAAHPMYPIGSNGASQAILDAQALAAALSQADGPEALQAYEAARRPATTQIVLANRRNGPEQVMQLAEERAPQGFSDVHAVIARAELEAIAARYKQTAGFSVEQVQRQIVPS